MSAMPEHGVEGLAQTDPKTEGTNKNARKRFLLFGLRSFTFTISILVTLTLVEGILRIAGVKQGEPQFGDIALGFITKPNLTETFVFPEYGGLLTMKTNNRGFHEDLDTQITKAAGKIRIIAVGDSQTAGECTNNESYPNILESALNAGLNQAKFEVINAGTGRYSPYQYYIKSTTQLIPLKPDHLIVGLYIGNDFMDLMRRDDRPYLTRSATGVIERHRPEFMMFDDPEKGGGLVASSRALTLAKRVLGPTFVYQTRRARMLWHDAATGNSTIDVASYMWDVKKLTDISLGFMTQSLLQHVWLHRFPQTLDTALALNKYILVQFRDACRRSGVRLTYVLIPTKLEIEPEDMQGVLKRVQNYDSYYTLSRLQKVEDQLTDQVLRDCAEVGIAAIDLRAPMRARHHEKQFYYPEEMHLNPEGNRAIAGILHDMLVQD